MDQEKRQAYQNLVDSVIKGEDASVTVAEIIKIRERELLAANDLDVDYAQFVSVSTEQADK